MEKETKAALRRDKERKLAEQICPQCGNEFRLEWDTDNVGVALRVRGCPSGGIYDVLIECPHCDYEEAL